MRGRARAPQRTCVACRRVGDKASLTRMVVVDGRIVPDRTGRAPGRGAYLCDDEGCGRAAAARLVSALRMPAGTPVEFGR